MQEPLLVLFDGNALIHRAFHALPPFTVRKTGEMIGAVYGFAQMLLKVISELKPTHCVIAFDKKGPTALFNSITSLDILRAHNGINVNAKFDTATLKGDHGCEILEYLILTYFKKGGMQVQLNVLDT